MASQILVRFTSALRKIENVINNLISQQFPPGSLGLSIAGLESNNLVGLGESQSRSSKSQKPFSLIDDIFKDGIMWAAPRNRRTVERRLKRKFGTPEYSNKLLLPKTNLLVCNSCGHFHEAGVLCANCYAKVCNETKEMQEAVQAELGLSPVDKEVVVLYEGEKSNQPEEFWEGKRIIEMKKPRPAWFSKNLLQQSTTPPATSTDVKPSELA